MEYVNPVIYQHGLEGDGYISPCEKYFWVKIPKCASTYIENLLISLDWKIDNYRHRDDKDSLIYFSVLRDPIDRWISGIVEYLTINKIELSDLSDVAIKLIFDAKTFDRHTQNQCYYLESINLQNTIFFKFDQQLSKNLENWFNSQNLKFNPAIENKKQNKSIERSQKLLFFKELTDGNYKKNITEWYNYELYQILPCVKFYD